MTEQQPPAIKPGAPPLFVTGAAMDTIVPKNQRRLRLLAGAAVLALSTLALALWHWLPHGLQVRATDVRIAAVQSGAFLDELTVRSQALALNSVVLDSVESGRVEELFVKDGSLVQSGEALFRISNPQRHLELLQRQAEHTQQISNLATLRVAFEASHTEHQRRRSELEFKLSQSQKLHTRNLQLSQQHYIAQAVLDESADTLAQQQRALSEEWQRMQTEAAVKQDAIRQMEQAIHNLKKGLALVSHTVAALLVRAPVAGRLTDFHLQTGASLQTTQHIGRIDTPGQFKLSALVDEYYLNRVAVGRAAVYKQDGQDYMLEVSRVYPQIRDGRFTVELVFKSSQPTNLNPGQSLDVHITLGAAQAALFLPNGAYLNDSGGTWVWVMAANGVDAEKRAIKTGRRNPAQIEVLAGLKSGEQVIVSPYQAFGKHEHLQIKE